MNDARPFDRMCPVARNKFLARLTSAARRARGGCLFFSVSGFVGVACPQGVIAG